MMLNGALLILIQSYRGTLNPFRKLNYTRIKDSAHLLYQKITYNKVYVGWLICRSL